MKGLDGAKITYHLEARHLKCLTLPACCHLFVWKVPGDKHRATFPIPEFKDGVYFHSSICDEAYRVSDDTFPICPPTPKFWQHGFRGLAVNHWPPLFFDPWIKLIAGGGNLSMDPTPPDAPTVFPNPLTILDNTGTSIFPPPADCCYDWQVPTSPLLDVPSSGGLFRRPPVQQTNPPLTTS